MPANKEMKNFIFDKILAVIIENAIDEINEEINLTRTEKENESKVIYAFTDANVFVSALLLAK